MCIEPEADITSAVKIEPLFIDYLFVFSIDMLHGSKLPSKFGSCILFQPLYNSIKNGVCAYL